MSARLATSLEHRCRAIRQRSTFAVFLAALAACTTDPPTVRLHVDRREPVLGGKALGDAGAYEKLVGRVEFGLDPRSPENSAVAWPPAGQHRRESPLRPGRWLDTIPWC